MELNHQSGFTLLELLIAGTMIAVLAALSIPAYQKHVLRSNRALAKITLTGLASQQEAYALQHNVYATDFGALLGSEQVNANHFFLSRDGRKTKTLNGNGSSIYELELLDASAASFGLRASAVGSQLNDEDCQSLTLSSKEQRSATSRREADSSNCWK